MHQQNPAAEALTSLELFGANIHNAQTELKYDWACADSNN